MISKTEADRLFDQGFEYLQSSKFQEAFQFWQQALTLYRQIGDRSGEANSLKNLGSVHFDLEQYQQAIELYQQSVAINWEIGNHTEVVISLNILGIAYCNLGYYQQAIDSSQHALAIAREIGNSEDEGTSLGGLGNVYYCQGEYEKAIEYYKQSLDIARKIGNRCQEAASLVGLGNAYSCLGDYQTAIEHYKQWQKIARKMENCQGEAAALCNLGNAYYCLGKYKEAIECYHQSLNVAQKIGDRSYSLDGLGKVYSYIEKYQEAIEYYQQALNIAQKIGDRRGKAIFLCNLGHVFYKQGLYKQAIDYYQESLKIARNIGHCLQQAISLSSLGDAHSYLGEYQEAIEYYQASIDISQKIKERRGEGNALNNLAYTLLKVGRIVEAENTLRAGMKVKESLRAGLEDAYKVSIFERHMNTYCLLQELLILQNKSKDALEISERGRARAFVDLLTQQLSPELVEQITLAPPTLQEIQQVAQVQNSTLVEYSIIYDEPGEESELYIWVIKPTGEIAFHSVDLQPLRQEQNTSLSDLVSQARESLEVPQKRRDAPQLLRQLHELLIQPIANLLPENPEEPVIFIPQLFLFLVPFPALLDPETGKFLIEQHTILTAPSIQVLDSTRKRQQHLKDEWASKKDEKNSDFYLVVGNPTMPFVPKIGQPPEQLQQLEGAEEQARTIAKLLNTQPIIRDEATKVNIVQRMLSARLIHLATHGLLDDIRELGVPGAIALAPTKGVDNGFLTAGEILELKLKAELVVLSACLTGLGDIKGDGVIGLSRCLFLAGVPSVIVSLWSVPDEPTQYLMTEFYSNLQGGMNKAKALHQAILTTKQKFRSPVNWAGFTLIGEAE